MKKILLILLMIWGIAYGQCDTVTNLTVTNRTPTGATFSYTGVSGSTAYAWAVYLATSPFSFVSAGSTTSTTVNITGLQQNISYTLNIETICGVEVSSPASVTFSTLTSSIVYTPMTAAGYQFKYLKADTGFSLPLLDTSLRRGSTRAGQLIYRPNDGMYVWNGSFWNKVRYTGGTYLSVEGTDTLIWEGGSTFCTIDPDTTICYDLSSYYNGVATDADTSHYLFYNGADLKGSVGTFMPHIFVKAPGSITKIGVDSFLIDPAGLSDGLIRADVLLVDSTVTVSNVLFIRNDSTLTVTTGPSSFVINSADAGYYRLDKIYIGIDRELHYLPGIQDTSITVEGEEIPDGGILVTIINVFGNTITNVPIPLPTTVSWWSTKNQNGVTGQFIQVNNASLSYGSLGVNSTAYGYGTFYGKPNGTTGSTAVGAFSQHHNGVGSYNNTSVGMYSLWYGLTGHDNVAIGAFSGGYANRNHTISLGTNSGYNADRYFSISDSVTHMHWSFLDSAAGTAPSVIGKDGAGNWHVYQTPSGGGGSQTWQQSLDVGSVLDKDNTVSFTDADYWNITYDIAGNATQHNFIVKGDEGAVNDAISNFTLSTNGLNHTLTNNDASQFSRIIQNQQSFQYYTFKNSELQGNTLAVQPENFNVTVFNTTLSKVKVLNIDEDGINFIKEGIIQKIATPAAGTYYIPLKVNGNTADSLGNITISGGGSNVGDSLVNILDSITAHTTLIATKLTASNFVFNETPSGTINSSNVTFTLANTPVAGTVEIFQNRLTMILGVDYTVSGTTVTMTTAPETGALLRTKYIKP